MAYSPYAQGGSRQKPHRSDRKNKGYDDDDDVFTSVGPPPAGAEGSSGYQPHRSPYRSPRDKQDSPRAKVHGARRPSPPQTDQDFAPYPFQDRPNPAGYSQSPAPRWTSPYAGGELNREPYRLGAGDRDAAESESSTVDLEGVEMRHLDSRRQQRFQPESRPGGGRGGRKYQKYSKSPSSDSATRYSTRGQGMSNVRASAYSTLSIKSWSELDTEMSVVMGDLNKHFKPIFDKHGSEGVSVKKLKEELRSRRSQHLLGRESIDDRLRDADRDGDEYLSYEDFVKMITQDLRQERKLAFRGMMLSAVGSIGILPKRMRDNFLANYKICPPPLFLPIITLIQVIIFAVYVADMEERGLEVTANSGYPFYSPLPYSPKKRYEAWRFITYMFIHDGYLHIVYNVISQLLFGFPLEMVHGWWRTAIIYLMGVTSGSLAHSVVDPYVGLVGASGGVYAILGAHLASVVTNWKEMNYKLCDQEEFDSRLGCALGRFLSSAPARLVIVVLIAIPDTALAIVRRVALDENLKVGVSAHVGGFLTGLFLGIPVLKNVNEHAWEKNLGWVTLVVFLLVFAGAIFMNSFFDERYPPTDWS